MPKQKTADKLDSIRHSLAHLLAAAVLKKFPDTKLGIGPTIEDGFYYDFLFKKPISAEVLPELEKLMREFISAGLEFSGRPVSSAEAKKIFRNAPFKLDLIKEFIKDKKPLTIYITGHLPKNLDKKSLLDSRFYILNSLFVDLCRGGHVKNTKEINPDAFKLTHLAGAYWRGSEKNPMLTRIYGLAFNSKKELDEYLKLQEEAKKRDHRKIGQDLDLFVFSDLVGKGLPLLTPKGMVIRKELERFIYDTETKWGYEHVLTPPLAKVELYKTSGHYPYYKDTMYPVMRVDEDELILRPMTCPHHFMLYKSRPHSYRELPLRIAELSPQFRYEKSGELTGLMRVRMFCLADAHIITPPDKAKEEIKKVLDLIDYVNKVLGFKRGEDYRYRLSLGDRKDSKKYYKDDKAWDKAEGILCSVLKELKAPFSEAEGEAAFYGPKIDVQVKKVSGQEETAFTVQYDFVMPKRFAMTYIDEKGKERQPVVIHRSSVGALERTMALLIEKYAGAFPLWLSPVQAVVFPVSDKFSKYGSQVLERIREAGIRVEIGDPNETLSKRIREAEIQKIPYVLVVGEKEEKGGTVNVRHYRHGQEGEVKVEKLLEKIRSEIDKKTV